MKSIFLLIALIPAFSISTFGQTQDKIVKVKGDTLMVSIQSVSENSITFTYPNEKAIQIINKKNVKQIIYSSGRTENFTTQIVIQGVDDWEKVILTTNPNDVEGLSNLGDLQGIGKTAMGGEKESRPKAEKDIKTQAAKKEAFIIFVKSQNFTKSIMSTFIITGTAYGY